MSEVSEFLDRQNEEIKKLVVPAQLAYWKATISGKKEDYGEYERGVIKAQKYFSNKDNFEIVKKFLKLTSNEIEKRQLELLYNDYLSCQGDIKLIEEITKKGAEIEQKFNTFRANVNGKELTDNEIKDILKTEKDSNKLKEVWEASKKQGELVEKDLLELIKLRNKLAKSMGFDNYHIMSLELSEQTNGEVEKIFLELENASEKKFTEFKDEMDEVFSKRYGVDKSELKPWHYQDLFFQQAPQIYDFDLDKFYSGDILKIAETFYKNIGLDVTKILERSSLYEIPGKYQHAYCIDMDRSGDVRIMESVKNNEHWMETTLHELGHAVDFSNRDNTMPYLLRLEAHTFVTESIALLFGRNSKNITFMKKYIGIDEKEVERIKDALKQQKKLDELAFLEWSQVMFNFERELYRNPEQDLNKLWWDMVKKYQKINFYRDKPDWASKIHIASYPVYYHNYVLGKILASQLNQLIVKEITGGDIFSPDYSNPKVGDFLKKKIIFHGKRYRWDELIRKYLGEELAPKYFIEEFCE